MAQVFVSYARRDGRDLAGRLVDRLEKASHAPWLDRSEIQGGFDWAQSIESAIDACDVLLALLTHGSYDSKICRGEQARALRKKKLVIPLLVQADADRPVYLETAHYIDFSDAGSFEKALSELIAQIGAGKGLRVGDLTPDRQEAVAQERLLHSMAAAFGAQTASWEEIRALTDRQVERFLDVVGSQGTRAGVYEPELFVERGAAEEELARFLEGDAEGMLVLGGSGAGKTNLLCDWATRLGGDGHAVLTYHGDKLRGSDIEVELARDLGLEDAAVLPSALAQVDELAGREGRRLVIIVDGVNRFREREDDGLRFLVESLDSLVARLPGDHVRVVVSCTTVAWSRIMRRGDVRLTWSRYHRTVRDEEALFLGPFTDDEAETAYDRYRTRFALGPTAAELPATLKLRLREPILLRLFAETGRHVGASPEEAVTDASIFRRYFEDRIRRREDLEFIDHLVREMCASRRADLSLTDLGRHEVLGPAVTSDQSDGSYVSLLDAGVLVQVEGQDKLFDDDYVRFAYPMIGSYALARRRILSRQPIDAAVRDLVELSEGLPFAWEAAEVVLVERGDDALLRNLAQSSDPDLRELAIEALTTLAASDENRARSVLTSLLSEDAGDGRRVALRAAYAIGPAMSGLFMQAALSPSAELRQVARDTLYLIWTGTSRGEASPAAGRAYFLWRRAPDFTYALLRDLVARASWLKPRETARILRFVLDLMITIYINHCDRQEVTEQTAELYHALTVERLHLDRLSLGSRAERVVLRAVAGVFARRVLDWMLVGDSADRATVFDLPAQERELLWDLAPLLDPGVALRGSEALLRRALDSDVDVIAGSAALTLAIHAHADFETAEPVLRALFPELTTRGRLWELLAFSVLLPTTPESWIPLLEDFTSELVERDPSPADSPLGLLRTLDIFFVPLGLAYGKRGGAAPLFQRLIDRGLASGDSRTVGRVIAGLGAVGFYYPKSALSTLSQLGRPALSSPEYRDALAGALGATRSLHVDLVDSFLIRQGMSAEIQRQVATAADSPLVRRLVYFLGFYNNAVHYCLFYPRMRTDLGMFALETLARAENANVFVAEYAAQGLRMARAARFDLMDWTKP